MVYKDKNGEEIKAGMTIIHDRGDEEIVYAGYDWELGVNASNEKFPDFCELDRLIYPLSQFNLWEWRIKK